MTTAQKNDAAPTQGDAVNSSHNNTVQSTPTDYVIARRQWEQARTWREVFGDAWTTSTPTGDTPGSRWSRVDGTGPVFEVYNVEGVDADGRREVDPAVKIVDGDAPFWWPNYDPRPVTKLTVWAGLNRMTRRDVYRDTGIFDDPRDWSWVWAAPGLNAVRRAADYNLKATRWHTLGSVLAWTSANVSNEAYLGGEGTRWRKGSLNCFVCNIGGASAGKGTTADMGPSLIVPVVGDQRFAGTTAMRPGNPRSTPFKTIEGIMKLLSLPDDDVDDADGDNGGEPTPPPAPRHIMIRTDELGAIGDLAATHDSDGGDTIQYFAQIWSGEDLTSPLASRGMSRRVPAHMYRASWLASTQAAYADVLLNRSDGGVTQRFLFMPSVLHRSEKLNPDAPAKIHVELKVLNYSGRVPYSDRAEAEMIDNTLHDAPGGDWDTFAVSDDGHNGHRDLLRAKTAAIVNVINGGDLAVTDQSWDIAGLIVDVSELTQERVGEVARQLAKERRIEDDADRLYERDEAAQRADDKLIADTARRLTDIVDNLADGRRRVKVRESAVKQMLSKKQREPAIYLHALHMLKEHGAVVVSDEGKGRSLALI